MYTASETLSSANITDIMQTAYIDYSMSVIVSRALPDARDGLKPVQRRILYAMLREGLLHNRPYDKCAGVVGEVLKNYHPHGDASVYDTLVRLAQTWVMRYPLIDPQGNASARSTAIRPPPTGTPSAAWPRRPRTSCATSTRRRSTSRRTTRSRRSSPPSSLPPSPTS